MVVLHPLEQRLRLADLAAVAARSCAAECGGRLRGLGAHPAPVAGSRAHVLEGAADGGLDQLQAGRVRLAVDLDHLPRLELRARRRVVQVDRLQPAAPVADHGEDRVREQVDGETCLRAHHAERVDQERLVVRDDHDDRVRRGEAIPFEVRVEDPHQRTAAAPRESEFEYGQRGAGEVLGGALHEIELGHTVIEVAREPVRRDRQTLAALAARAGGDAVDDGLTGGGNPA